MVNNSYACQHTPSENDGLFLQADTDHRCEACRVPMKVNASYHVFTDPKTQMIHDRSSYSRHR